MKGWLHALLFTYSCMEDSDVCLWYVEMKPNTCNTTVWSFVKLLHASVLAWIRVPKLSLYVGVQATIAILALLGSAQHLEASPRCRSSTAFARAWSPLVRNYSGRGSPQIQTFSLQ